MCGIVGAIGTPGKDMHNIFETMLTLSIIRGKESTGVAAFNNERVNIVKGVLFPMEIIQSDQYKKDIASKTNQNKILLGHTRQSTVGNIKPTNAHPFRKDHIILIHNGTLTYKMDVEGAVPETDSESICISIAQKGIEKTWKELRGDASIAFIDEKDNTLNLISNGKRPLHYAYIQDYSHLYFASEPWMIEAPIRRMGIKIKKNKIHSIEDDTLYTISLDIKKGRLSTTKKKLETFTHEYRYNNNYHSNNYVGNSYWQDYFKKNYGFNTVEKRKTETSCQSELFYNNNDTKHTYPSPSMLKINKVEFNSKYQKCYTCGNDLEYNSTKIIDDTPICDSCISTTEKLGINISSIKGA